MPKGKAVMVKVVFNDFPKLSREIKSVLQHISMETAEEIRANAVASLLPSGSVSPPGGPPASQTGKIAKSFDVRAPRRIKGHLIRAYLWNDDPNSVHQEYGTQKMAARPFIRPAVRRAIPGFVNKIRDLERYLKSR